MARHGYNCGGKGRYGNPSGPCTICGRIHPKGKKKSNWRGCISNAFTADAPTQEKNTIKKIKKPVTCDSCGIRKVRITTKDGKFCRKCLTV